jgi:hypothetical protein
MQGGGRAGAARPPRLHGKQAAEAERLRASLPTSLFVLAQQPPDSSSPSNNSASR